MKIIAGKILKNNRGIALIITILIISLMIPMSLQFITSTFFYNISASNLNDGIVGDCAARSGVDYALAVLYEDALSDALSNGSDSLQEPWADLAALNSDAASLFDEAKLEIKIIDLTGKMNVNRLVMQGEEGAENKEEDEGKKKNKKEKEEDKDKKKEDNKKEGDEKKKEEWGGSKFDEVQKNLLTRLLKSTELELEEEEVENIINAIKDWIDPDDEVTEEGGFGAESTYYQGLDKPYSCRNGPLETLEELLLIKGMTKEIFSAISGSLTVYGDEKGQININTADKPVLKSLSDDIHDEEADTLVSYREEAEKKDLADRSWYQKALNTQENLIHPDLIVTQSKYFEIISTGSKGAMRKQVRAIVERKGQALTVLSWKIEDG